MSIVLLLIDEMVVLDKFGKNIAVFKHFTLNYVFIFAMNFNEREFRKNFLIFNLITYKNDFYEEPIESFSNVFLTLFAFAGQMMGQQKTITGRVVDALNEGMPGVNVQVKGTTSGTITNIDGDFSISVPNTKSVLVFTFIGYVKQEVAVGNQTKLNIQMKDDTQSLDEVVVVAYGTARKGDLTGALTTMRPDANEAAKAVSIDNLLEGKVAGLVVSTASSNPGAASSITIRGASSLRGDNQPLYVIDNIPQASTGEFSSSWVLAETFRLLKIRCHH